MHGNRDGTEPRVPPVEWKVPPMLRSFGIRAKILAVLALPVVVLSLAAGVIATAGIGESRKASQVEELVRHTGGLTELLRGLQAERALTVAVLSGDEASRAALDEVRPEVSKLLDETRADLAEIDHSLLEESAQVGVQRTIDSHDLVPELRRQVDGGVLTAGSATIRFSEIIATDIALPSAIADGLDDRVLAQNLRAYTASEELAEAIATERDLMTPVVAAGKFTPEQFAASKDAAVRTDLVRENTTRIAQSTGVRTPPTAYTFQLARQRTLEESDGIIDGITVEGWRTAADDDIAALGNGIENVVNAAADRSGKLAGDAEQYALQVIVGALLAVIVPVVLALLLARRITRPLRRLTEAAAQIRADLPMMVERMATPGEGPGMTISEIPVESNDEVGRLASAFNDVNSTTVQVAQEQAALRGSIAAMFVNVARRDQVLLSRQLSFLDQLERTEENPDTLDNLFKLDHLATRMRRNAESLLVLAGIDTGRRLRRPMPLSDVIRTASSEIEHYERVDLAQHVDPPMIGHTALLSAHMLAELLENATSFSDPGTRVVVATDAAPDGIVVTVTDEGLGMSADELEEANDRIQNPPVSEVVGAQRLGFYVVGRLAKRLDAKISLAAGDGRGTVVTIGLPAALFVPGSVETDDATPAASSAATATGPGDSSPRSGSTVPTGAESLGAAADALNGAAAAAAAASVAPIIIAGGSESSLPQRGGREVTPADLPTLPTRAPAAAAPTLPTLPQRGAGGLPSRTPAAPLPAEPAHTVPAQRTEAPAPASRTGLFTGFRARRAEAVGVADESAATPAEETRAGPSSAEDVVSAVPEAPKVPEVPEVAQLDDEEAYAPEAEVYAPEPAYAPEPEVAAETGYAPATSYAPATEYAPTAEFAPFEDTPLYAATIAAVAPVAEALAGEAETLPARRPDADGTTDRRSAASELSALASRPAPVEAPAAAEPPPPPVPVFSSASALDILPGADRGRSGSRGLKLPRRGRDSDGSRRPTTAPVPVPVSYAPVPVANVSAPQQASQLVPVVEALSDGAVPFVPMTAPPQSGDHLRNRSALASEALSELSRLSSYRPEATLAEGPSPALARRTRGASPAAEVAAPQQAVSSRPGRSAAEVRSMLSGFQAGVARGRGSTTTTSSQDVSE